MEIRLKKRFQLKNDANVVFDELEEIRKSNGGVLVASAVLNIARHSESKLHKEFEWDDGKAAEKYRLDQARYIIRSIEIVDGKNHMDYKVYQCSVIEAEKTSDTSLSVYLTTEEILENPSLREQRVERGLGELKGWCKKYGIYPELKDLCYAINNMI